MIKQGRLETGKVIGAADEIVKVGLELERLFERMATVTKLQRESPRNIEPVEVGAVIAELENLDPNIF